MRNLQYECAKFIAKHLTPEYLDDYEFDGQFDYYTFIYDFFVYEDLLDYVKNVNGKIMINLPLIEQMELNSTHIYDLYKEIVEKYPPIQFELEIEDLKNIKLTLLEAESRVREVLDF